MPTVRSRSKKAFAKNLKTELRAGKPKKQALAIAYSIQRSAPKSGTRIKVKAKKKRKLSPAQLAALAKGRAAMAAKRGGKSRARKPLTRKRKRGSVVGVHVARKKSRRSRKGIPHMARKKARRSHAIVRHGGGHSRARNVLRKIGSAASDQKHMIGAVAGAAALGLAKKQGIEIPHVGTLGEAATLALAGYALDKFGIIKSPMLRHATTGFAAIAVYEAAQSGLGGGGGGGKAKGAAATTTTSGEFLDGGYPMR